MLSRAALLRTLPRGADEHAVEMAVARLRAGLGAPGVVQTVVKRGYRLPSTDPPSRSTPATRPREPAPVHGERRAPHRGTSALT